MAKNTIKTVALIAGEVKEIEANRRNAIVRNNGSEIVYASSTSDVSAGIDGTMAISAGSSALVRDVGSASGGDNKLFLLANGGNTAVEVEFINDLNFKCEKKGGGGGGQPVDAYTKGEVDGFLAEKVGFADYANSAKGGVVKVDGDKGILINNGVIEINQASAFDFAMNNAKKPVTPSNLGLAMKQYGINDTTQIGGIESDIANIEENVKNIEDDLRGYVSKDAIDKNYGIAIGETGKLFLYRAENAHIDIEDNKYRPIVPYNIPHIMSNYGINSKIQISEMQTDINDKIDTNVFIAENLIECPFYFDDGYTNRGVIYTSTPKGSVIINGTPTGSSYARLNKDNLIMLERKKYILSGCPSGGSDTTYAIGVTKGSTSATAVIKEYGNSVIIDNTNGEFDEGINITVAVYSGTYENLEFKPMLEIGEIKHVFQPYKLSMNNLSAKQLSTPTRGTKTSGITVNRSGNIVSFTALVTSFTDALAIINNMPTPVSNMAFIPVGDADGKPFTTGSCWISNDNKLTYHGTSNSSSAMVTGIYICK